MPDIKIRETAKKTVKALDRSAVAAQRMKDSYVRTKEKAEESVASADTSPEGYAADRAQAGMETAAREGAYQMDRVGRKAVRATKENFSSAKEQEGQRRAETDLVQAKKQADQTQAKEQAARHAAKKQAVQQAAKKRTAQQAKQQAQTAARESVTSPARYPVRKMDADSPAIKTVERSTDAIKTADKGRNSIKTAHNSGKAARKAAKTTGKAIKTAEQASHAVIKTGGASARMTQQAAKKAAKASYRAAQAAKKSARATAHSAKAAAKATVSAVRAIIAGTKALITALIAGGWVSIVIILIVVLLGCAVSLFGGESSSNSYTPVSAEVEAYDPLIRQYAAQHGIPEYVELIKAVMMQESGGQGSDPMQASECGYNTRYPNTPSGITDPEYSIDVGIQNLAACLSAAEVENPIDMEHIKLALQGYNFGNGYISWAHETNGGYSYANAVEFSVMQAERLGWDSYGDTQYVSHVLRYYPYGRAFTSGGNQAIVEMALSQLGNEGGEPYWSWYGFDARVEWCACFVSWCSGQCGYIETGIIPRFSLVSDGVAWFQERGQWQGRNYEPAAGDVIFFDWDGDGSPDHVGLVEKCENGMITTVEGNSGDAVRENTYAVGSASVFGFGTPAY